MEQQGATTTATARLRRHQVKTGVVVRAKMEKTVVVEVERLVMDRLYGKYVRRSSRFMTHDEKNACKVGDRVTIRETRPLSRHKRWVVQSIVEKAVTD
jgi:small subunit ribosomal protein S17